MIVWWMSCKKMTVKVITKQNSIVGGAPIINRFVGQPRENLQRWMKKFGNYKEFDITPTKKDLTKMATTTSTPDDSAPELYRRYRPKSFKEVVGQTEAIQTLTEMGKSGKIPHALLFTGPSGCGKTTLARILRLKLKCSDIDFVEINAADDRGIDMIREIKARMGMSPLGGKSKVWLIDEMHQMTPQAQESFLKYLEDTPNHVYFFLATTDPQKLKKTIITRCTEIRCKEITPAELKKLVISVAKEEGKELADSVADRLSLVADGSGRKALVLLHAILGIPTVEGQIAAIDSNDTKAQSIEICRMLFSKNSNWKDMAAILSKIEDDPESIRYQVLGYCRAILLKGDNPRARFIMDQFRDNYYDTKVYGLLMSCYDAVKG